MISVAGFIKANACSMVGPSVYMRCRPSPALGALELDAAQGALPRSLGPRLPPAILFPIKGQENHTDDQHQAGKDADGNQTDPQIVSISTQSS